MPFIFLIVASVCISFSSRIEYLWHPKRSADGQVLLYPIEDIALDMCALCNESYCFEIIMRMTGDNVFWDLDTRIGKVV